MKKCTYGEYEGIREKVKEAYRGTDTIKDLRVKMGGSTLKYYAVTFLTKSGKPFRHICSCADIWEQILWMSEMHPGIALVSYNKLTKKVHDRLKLLDGIESQMEVEGFEVSHRIFKDI